MKKLLSKSASLFTALLFLAFVQCYSQPGTPDITFGTNGKYAWPIESAGMGAFALQSDNKIVAGTIKYYNGGNDRDFFTVRFLSNGGIDSSYGTNGIGSLIPIPGENEEIRCMAIQPDDKILLGGRNSYLSKQSFLIARFKANGTIDSSFGTNGYNVIPITVGGTDMANAIVVLGNGKILLGGSAGTSPTSPAVVRLNADGSLDNGFGVNGIAVFTNMGFFSYAWDMKVQSDGKILLDLARTNGGDPFSIMRLNTNGTIDNSFGNSGLSNVLFNSGVSSNYFTVQGDDKIIVAGAYSDPNIFEKRIVALARLNTDGTLDNTFGIGGKVLTDVGFAISAVVPLIQNPDGKILAFTQVKNSSSGNWKYLTLRYLTNGDLDTEWGGVGYVEDSFANTNHYAGRIFNYADKVLISGHYSELNSVTVWNFARYNSCGISITGQPVNQTKALGSMASFNVTSTSPSAGYQWQTEGAAGWEDLGDAGQYSGTHTHSLHIANVTLANDQQRFRTIALSGACTDTSGTAILTVDSTTGIAGINRPNSFRIYPNPVNDLLHIAPGEASEHLVGIRVTDMLGKTVDIVYAKGKNDLTISCKNWAMGIYNIQIILQNGTTSMFQVVKK